jgi:hypothetical protein
VSKDGLCRLVSSEVREVEEEGRAESRLGRLEGERGDAEPSQLSDWSMRPSNGRRLVEGLAAEEVCVRRTAGVEEVTGEEPESGDTGIEVAVDGTGDGGWEVDNGDGGARRTV